MGRQPASHPGVKSGRLLACTPARLPACVVIASKCCQKQLPSVHVPPAPQGELLGVPAEEALVYASCAGRTLSFSWPWFRRRPCWASCATWCCTLGRQQAPAYKICR